MKTMKLFFCSIIIHFFLTKGYMFKVFNQYAYSYLGVFYISVMVFGFFLLKNNMLIDIIFLIAIPYMSSVISFFCISMQVSHQIVINNLWSSLIIGVSLPYIALYAWLLSMILIAFRVWSSYINKFIKKA